MLSKEKRENLRFVNKGSTTRNSGLFAVPLIPAKKPLNLGFNSNSQKPAITIRRESKSNALTLRPRELTKEEKQENLIYSIIESIKRNDPSFDILNLRNTRRPFSYYKSNQFIDDLKKNTELTLLEITIYIDQNKEIRKFPGNNRINSNYDNRLTRIEISLYKYSSYFILPYYNASDLERCWIGTENILNVKPQSPNDIYFSFIESENKICSTDLAKVIKPLSAISLLKKLDLNFGSRYFQDPEFVKDIAFIIQFNQKISSFSMNLNAPSIKLILDVLTGLVDLKELRLYNYSLTRKNVDDFQDFWISDSRKSLIHTLELGKLIFVNEYGGDHCWVRNINARMSELLYILFIWKNKKELKRLYLKCEKIEVNEFHQYILEDPTISYLEELGIFSSKSLPDQVEQYILGIWEKNTNLVSLQTNEDKIFFKRGDEKAAKRKMFISEVMTISSGVYVKQLDNKINHFVANRDIAFSILLNLGKDYGFEEISVQLCITLVLNNFQEFSRQRQENPKNYKRDNVKNWWSQSIFHKEKEVKVFSGQAEDLELHTIGFASS